MLSFVIKPLKSSVLGAFLFILVYLYLAIWGTNGYVRQKGVAICGPWYGWNIIGVRSDIKKAISQKRLIAYLFAYFFIMMIATLWQKSKL